jgi:hypothetical protein
VKTRAAFNVLLAILPAGLSALATEPTTDVPPSNYFAGEYAIVGRAPDSSHTYSGTIKIEEKSSGQFSIARKIDGRTTIGVAFFDPAGPPAEHPVVLRIRFTDHGKEFEGTFLWRSDLDNYPRLTGFIYQRGGAKTKSAGLEAWFAADTLRR